MAYTPLQGLDSSSSKQTANLILSILLCLLVLTAAIGNGILIFVVLHSKDHRHQSDFFIASLASADFLMCVLVFPLALTYQLEGNWRFGKTTCKVWIVLDVALSAVAIYTMSVICMNVCFHVRQSFVAVYEFAQRWIHAVNATIWLFAFVIANIPLILDYDLREEINDYTFCMFNEPPVHAVLVSAIMFFIPTTWSFFLYGELMTTYIKIMKLKRSRIDPENMTVAQKGLFTVSPHINAIFTMGIKLTIYLLCWMPYFVVKVVHAFCPTCEDPVASQVAVWLPYVSSWVSPFVYGMLNRRVRDRMKDLCPRICWAQSTGTKPSKENLSLKDLEQKEHINITPTIRNTESSSKESCHIKSSEKDSKFENGTTNSNMPSELMDFPADDVPKSSLERPRNTFEGESEEGDRKQLWEQQATKNMIPEEEQCSLTSFCKGKVAEDLNQEKDAKSLPYHPFQGTVDRQATGKIPNDIRDTRQHDVGGHNIRTQYESLASSWDPSTHKLIENAVGQEEEGAVGHTAAKTMNHRKLKRSFGIGRSTCPASDPLLQARDLYTLAVTHASDAGFPEPWMRRFSSQESLKSFNEGLVLPFAFRKPWKLRENDILNFLEPDSEDGHEAAQKTNPQRRERSVDTSIYSRHAFWTAIDEKSSTFVDFHNSRSLICPSTMKSSQKTSSSFLSEMYTGQKKSPRRRSCKQGSDMLHEASSAAGRVPDDKAGWWSGLGDAADFCVTDDASVGRTLQSSEDENAETTTSDGNTEAEDAFWGTMTFRPRRPKRRKLVARAKLSTKNSLDLRESVYSSASESSVLSIGTRPQGLLALMLLGTDLTASVSSSMVLAPSVDSNAI